MTITPKSVREILNVEDIEGLRQLGAPGDEYESEAQMIATAITRLTAPTLTEQQLANLVSEVWTKMFGPFSTEEIERRASAFQQVARRVLEHHK